MFILPPLRMMDDFGAGYFGAPRGNRTHNGIDFVADPGAIVCSVCDGRISRYGYPYGDDLNYRYVEITDFNGDFVRYFYVTAFHGDFSNIGAKVSRGSPIGVVQDIAGRYNTPAAQMKNHFHFEVKRDGEYVDPVAWLQTAEAIGLEH
jgi:murein DD-endopeptidase MepM/ murein hydrolase activator NlpD